MVSKSLVDMGLVRATGVLAEPVNESDHKPVLLDTDAVLNSIGEVEAVGGHQAGTEGK